MTTSRRHSPSVVVQVKALACDFGSLADVEDRIIGVQLYWEARSL